MQNIQKGHAIKFNIESKIKAFNVLRNNVAHNWHEVDVTGLLDLTFDKNYVNVLELSSIDKILKTALNASQSDKKSESVAAC